MTVNVSTTPSSITPVNSRAEAMEESIPPAVPIKNIVIIAINVGNLPLQGTKLFVKIASRRSRGGINNTAAHNACRVAAKTHAHGEGPVCRRHSTA